MKTNNVKKSANLLFRPSKGATLGVEAAELLRRVDVIIANGLRQVITSNNNVLASGDRLFRHPFGRDSAITADRLIYYDSNIARQIILLMVATQGVKYDNKTEEEPGKVFHEIVFRSKNPEQQAIFEALSAKLGIGDGEKFVSYTSVDATLEFIHLVAHYIKIHGRELLHVPVSRQGYSVTVAHGLAAAVQWVLRTIERSDIGLIGAHRINPGGVIVPDLLDGATSFMHEDGKTLVNHTKEVNTINFQSLGYRALKEAAEIAITPAQQAEWLAAAEVLRQQTIKRFWMPKLRRVAMAVDRDESGQPRLLTVKSILPAAAIRTGIFDSTPDIIDTSLEHLYTSDMMTCVGPRTQTLAVNVGYTRYQEPPWPVLIGRAIEGAIRRRKYDIAIDLIERLLVGAFITGKAEEFHQVTPEGEVGIYASTPRFDTKTIVATNKPEAPQAWTVATLWWIRRIALPFLDTHQEVEVRRSDVDLSLNKSIKTIRYTLNQAKAWKIEEQIQGIYK